MKPMKQIRLLIILALLLLLSVLTAPAVSVNVLFDDNINIGVSYRVHWGTASGVYPNSLSFGTNKVGTITNLNSGTRYFFAVTAFTPTAVSDFSAEVQHVTAIVPPTNVRAVTNITQAAISPSGPWTNVAINVIDIPEPYSFVRVEVKPKKL
jgi:hypothetical protein